MQSTEKRTNKYSTAIHSLENSLCNYLFYFPVSPAECHSVSPTPPNLCTGKEVICVLFSEMNTRLLDF